MIANHSTICRFGCGSWRARPTLAAAYHLALAALDGRAYLFHLACTSRCTRPRTSCPCRQTRPVRRRVDIRQGGHSAVAGRESDRRKRPATPVLPQYRLEARRLSWYARQAGDRPADLRLDEDRVRRLHRLPGSVLLIPSAEALICVWLSEEVPLPNGTRVPSAADAALIRLRISAHLQAPLNSAKGRPSESESRAAVGRLSRVPSRDHKGAVHCRMPTVDVKPSKAKRHPPTPHVRHLNGQSRRVLSRPRAREPG
jgi:hypothetical protein